MVTELYPDPDHRSDVWHADAYATANGVDAAKAPAVVNIISVSSSELTRQLKLIRTVISPAILSGDGRTERWKWQTC